VAAKKWYENAPLIEHPNKGLQLTPRKGSLQENRRTAVARTTSLLGTVINPCPSSGIDLLDRYYAVLVCRMIYQGDDSPVNTGVVISPLHQHRNVAPFMR